MSIDPRGASLLAKKLLEAVGGEVSIDRSIHGADSISIHNFPPNTELFIHGKKVWPRAEPEPQPQFTPKDETGCEDDEWIGCDLYEARSIGFDKCRWRPRSSLPWREYSIFKPVQPPVELEWQKPNPWIRVTYELAKEIGIEKCQWQTLNTLQWREYLHFPLVGDLSSVRWRAPRQYICDPDSPVTSFKCETCGCYASYDEGGADAHPNDCAKCANEKEDKMAEQAKTPGAVIDAEFPSAPEDDKLDNLRAAIESSINAYSIENRSNTPDFVLAEFLIGCLDAFDKATNRREEWHGRKTGAPEPTKPMIGQPFGASAQEKPEENEPWDKYFGFSVDKVGDVWVDGICVAHEDGWRHTIVSRFETAAVNAIETLLNRWRERHKVKLPTVNCPDWCEWEVIDGSPALRTRGGFIKLPLDRELYRFEEYEAALNGDRELRGTQWFQTMIEMPHHDSSCDTLTLNLKLPTGAFVEGLCLVTVRSVNRCSSSSLCVTASS